jgi:hypothetical protein
MAFSTEGVVSTSNPSYNNGDHQPLSLDQNGNLRVTTAQLDPVNDAITVYGTQSVKGDTPIGASPKGVQTANAMQTQDLKDSGRTYLSFTLSGGAGTASETLISFSQNKGGSVSAGVSSYVITTGKTLRLTGISVSCKSGAAAIATCRVTIRHNTAGATTNASPVVVVVPEVNTNSATSGTSGWLAMDLPEGIEFYGDGTQTIGASHIDSATTNVLNITLFGYEY